MNYNIDKRFTDQVHWNLAMPQIYEILGWTAVLLKPEQAKRLDMADGIDYVFLNQKGELVTVQERFREAKYLEYNDFTIRYRRDTNRHLDRQKSEYYKIKADYFVYGITNGYKEILGPTMFLKMAVVDLDFVKNKIDEGQIVISDREKTKTCRIENDRLVCPINQNTDGSSSFFPIDIEMLVALWGSEVLLLQTGFINNT